MYPSDDETKDHLPTNDVVKSTTGENEFVFAIEIVLVDIMENILENTEECVEARSLGGENKALLKTLKIGSVKCGTVPLLPVATMVAVVVGATTKKKKEEVRHNLRKKVFSEHPKRLRGAPRPSPKTGLVSPNICRIENRGSGTTK